jgi:hypothetical protein
VYGHSVLIMCTFCEIPYDFGLGMVGVNGTSRPTTSPENSLAASVPAFLIRIRRFVGSVRVAVAVWEYQTAGTARSLSTRGPRARERAGAPRPSWFGSLLSSSAWRGARRRVHVFALRPLAAQRPERARRGLRALLPAWLTGAARLRDILSSLAAQTSPSVPGYDQRRGGPSAGGGPGGSPSKYSQTARFPRPGAGPGSSRTPPQRFTYPHGRCVAPRAAVEVRGRWECSGAKLQSVVPLAARPRLTLVACPSLCPRPRLPLPTLPRFVPDFSPLLRQARAPSDLSSSQNVPRGGASPSWSVTSGLLELVMWLGGCFGCLGRRVERAQYVTRDTLAATCDEIEALLPSAVFCTNSPKYSL